MPKKIKFTRPELKRQRDALLRFNRYLPMLKLKQQQLQLTLREVSQKRDEAERQLEAAVQRFVPYENILAGIAGLNLRQLAEPKEVVTSVMNVAGVKVPVYEQAVFGEAVYSLFSTPAWVDRTLLDMREVSRRQAHLEVLTRQYGLLRKELTKILQRVNLFEKVMIPFAMDAIRRIRIHLGDEMTAAVGRAKIAKSKLTDTTEGSYEDKEHTTHS